jgi:hypothetical protein
LAYGFDRDFPQMQRLSRLAPLFVSPEGTGANRYVSVLKEEDGSLFWFKVKKGFHLFDAYTGEAKWSHKELPGFDGKYTLLWEEDYLLYSTKKGVARLDIESGKIAWSTELEKLKFKDGARWWETDHWRQGLGSQSREEFLLQYGLYHHHDYLVQPTPHPARRRSR